MISQVRFRKNSSVRSDLIEKLNRLQDENYQNLICATSILEAADSIEKELAKLREQLSKAKMQIGVDYSPPTNKTESPINLSPANS